MSFSENPIKESAILDLIDSFSSLEWRHFQPRYPQTFVEGRLETIDMSNFPPSFSFRFKDEAPEIVECLMNAVDKYKGRISWGLFSHKRYLPGTNWIICPVRLWSVREKALNIGISPGKYMAESEPDFGPKAYGDVKGLYNHIRKALAKRRILTCRGASST